MSITISTRRLDQPDHDSDLPPGLDPEACPIIATHYFGVDLTDVRQTWWSLARQGYPPTAEADAILIEGG